MLGSVGRYLGNGMFQIVGIDIDDQLLVGILNDVACICILIFHPAGSALLFEDLSKIAWIFLDLHHSGLQPRQIEYVVDEV